MVQVGPYQLTRCLGKGGMGEVWLGKRMAMGDAAKTVAVKLLHTPDPAARDNFIKEAKLAMLLRHSTIVQVNDVGESQGVCFMEMEWVDGLDLSRLNGRLAATQQRLSFTVAAYVVGELLKALAYAHALDVDGKRETIVHRDVTPQNVLISKSGEVKLTDFGIAFMTSDKTSSDLIKGKSRYMSPEHVRQVREPCIDIFGVGAMFHEMLDGRKFRYTGKTEVDLFSMAFSGEVPPLSIELPAELERLRRGLLAGDVEQRFPTARAALAVLRRWPRYRDASEELEALVNKAGASDAPLVATDLPTPVLAQNEWTRGGSNSVTRAETSATEVARSKDVVVAASPVRAIPRNRGAAVVMFALMGMGVAGLGGAAVLGQMRETGEDPPVVVAEVEPVHTEPAPKIEVPPTPTIAPVVPIVVPIVAPTEPPVPEVEAATPNPTPIRKKTRVTIKASGYPWVKIRIGGTTYVLDRKSRASTVVSLKPGKHSVGFQIDEEEPWQEIGKITIPARPNAVLELRKPGTFVVQ